MADHILLVDDNEDALALNSAILEGRSFKVSIASSARDALTLLKTIRPDIIVLDLIMPKMNGYEACREIKANTSTREIPVIFLTSVDDQLSIEKCFDIGGADYINVSNNPEELVARINLHIGVARHRCQARSTASEEMFPGHDVGRAVVKHPNAFASVVTSSDNMYRVFEMVENVAGSSRPVLITGETGVGKEKIASIIHQISGRQGRFVTVNIAGLDDTLFSDALFGHAKGAYTHAEGNRAGFVETAKSGSLFLDEIGDLTGESQVKLLRLIQENEYYPLGSDSVRKSDTRIIVATNKNLSYMSQSGEFREDLYYRLKTHRITLPPLRDRLKDLPILLDHFFKRAADELQREVPGYPNYLIPFLRQYDFPGNIRELEAMVFDAVSRTKGENVALDVFREIFLDMDIAVSATKQEERCGITYSNGPQGAFPTIDDTTDQLIDEALRRTNGNQSRAAKLLGISRQALNKRLSRKRKKIVE